MPALDRPRRLEWILLIVIIVVFIIGIIIIYILPLNTVPTQVTQSNVPQFSRCSATPECVTGLTCRDGRCTKECDSNIDCGGATPQYCNKGVCVIGTVPLGQTCNTTSQCATGLTCVGSICTSVCSTINDCPNDKICVDGSCVSGTLNFGDQCNFNSQCPLDTVCRQTVISSVKRCRQPCQIDLPGQSNNSSDCPVCSGCTETFCDEIYYVCRSP